MSKLLAVHINTKEHNVLRILRAIENGTEILINLTVADIAKAEDMGLITRKPFERNYHLTDRGRETLSHLFEG